jgi:hypothetical protein
MMAGVWHRGLPSAGLISGPLAWGISTQLNYALAPFACSSGLPLIEIVATALVAFSLVGTLFSWQAWRRLHDGMDVNAPNSHAPHLMIAVLGIAAGLLFGLVVAMQGTAALFLDGCT